MTNIKELSSSLSGALSPEAEAQAAKMNTKMDADRILLAGAVNQLAETKERLKKEQDTEQDQKTEETEDKAPQDTARLSRQSKWFGIEGRRLEQEPLAWILEMEKELWENLLYWMPVPGEDLSRQLAELSRLYLSLLESVYIHTMGDAQKEQLARLDAVLAQKLNLLMDRNLKGLEHLLEHTGQTKALRSLKASLYRQTTGTGISSRAADAFFSKGKSYSTGNPNSSLTTAGSSTESYSRSRQLNTAFPAEEGMLYKPSKAGNIQVNQTFEAHKKSSELQMSLRKTALGSAVGKDITDGKALLSANRFAEHLNDKGNLFKNPGMTAQNDELQGFLSAITFIKGQVYASSSGRNSTMEIPLKSAINQMIDHYLSRKSACDIYYYTIGIYEKTKNPQKALEDGFGYAYKRFSEKKEQSSEGARAPYSKQAGFFRMLQQGQPLEIELKRGLQIIEENWKEFLKAIGEDANKRLSLTLQKYSPWGSLLETGQQKRNVNGKIVFRTAVSLFAVVLVFLLLRFFLG